MTRIETAGLLALILALAAGMVLPAGAISGPGVIEQTDGEQPSVDTVSAEVGQQLSTVLSTTTTEVRSGADEAGFEKRLNESNSTERGEAIAERAEELADRATEIRDEYDAATEAYRNGEIDASTFAQRIATLTATADTVDQSVDRLADRAAEVPDAERRALGITDSELGAIAEEIDPVSGRTAGAILSQFTAEAGGEIEIEVDGGIAIEVSSGDDEQSRQFERPRDGDGSYELNQSEALEFATGALSQQDGEWVLTSVGTDDGAYEFEFFLDGPGEGEAEVAVDGATGTVFELEESVEFDDEDDEDDEQELERLAIRVTEGEPAPGENVTLLVTGAGEPVADATVEINEETVGGTDANGTITVTLPSEEAEIEATAGEAEGELEFEFEEGDEDREAELGATADIENGTVTVSVFSSGEPVEGATVTANEESVGTTAADGTVSFDLPAGEELEIDIASGDREAELEYELEDGEDEELAVQVTEGHPVPGETVTLSVTGADGPVEGATVDLNEETVGQTDANGTITVTLPSDGEAEIDVLAGDAEGELEFEFEADEDETEDSEGDDEPDDSDESDDEDSESESEEVEDEEDEEGDDDDEEAEDDSDGDDEEAEDDSDGDDEEAEDDSDGDDEEAEDDSDGDDEEAEDDSDGDDEEAEDDSDGDEAEAEEDSDDSDDEEDDE